MLLPLLLCLTGCFVASSGYSRLSEYNVQSGDTLYEIAQRYELDWRELAKFNNISNPNNLEVGQLIFIPQSFESSDNFMHEPHQVAAADHSSSISAAVPQAEQRSLGRINLGEARHFIDKLSSPLERGVFRLNSRFGWRSGSFHEGIDLAAEPGTDVFAAHSGEVVYAGQGMSGYGKILAIRQGPIMTVYAHNESLAVDFGDSVEQGERIARVGSTGRASGPHLHFELRVRTTEGRYAAVNPMIFYP